MEVDVRVNNKCLVIAEDGSFYPRNSTLLSYNEADVYCKINGGTIVNVYDDLKKYNILSFVNPIDSYEDQEIFYEWQKVYMDRNIKVKSLPIMVNEEDEYLPMVKSLLKEYYSAVDKFAFSYVHNLLSNIKTYVMI